MDFRLTPQQAAFRDEVRAFLRETLPHVPEDDLGEEGLGIGGWSPWFSKRLAERGWIALPWPKEYGGLGLAHIEQAIFNEEIAYHRAPAAAHRRGVFYVGPILIRYGTEEQRRVFLRQITAGGAFFCQGFSEPGAGSDLASLQTRAVQDGDDFVINGQKIWTSDAHRADFCWLAARTDPEAPKHRGISNFIVDMHSAGVTVQPLTNMADGHFFNQVFFDNLRVPRENLVGELHRGWYQTATTLDFERSSIASFAGVRRTLEEIIELARALPTRPPVSVRHMLIDLRTATETGTVMAYAVASMQDRGLMPSKEASLLKVFSSELQQRVAGAGMKVCGMHGQLAPGTPHAPLMGRLERMYLGAVAATIGGGTSEIQRNVIATRGLGLPRN